MDENGMDGNVGKVRKHIKWMKYAVPDDEKSPRRFTCVLLSRGQFISNKNPKFSARYARCRIIPVSSIVPFNIDNTSPVHLTK